MGSVTQIRVGDQVWVDGERATIVEFSASATLIQTSSTIRRVSTRTLLDLAQPDDPDDARSTNEEFPAAVLTSLTVRERADFEHRLALLEQAEAMVHEGRVTSIGLAYESVAELAGTTRRSLERWARARRDGGPAALAGRSSTGYGSRVDPRWDATCEEVLRQFVPKSTPTKEVVIRRVAHELQERHGEGVVAVPSRATAFRRLDELSKGRHAFGSAKQRRSVAARPEPPFGRLRATHPGEYVVLDTSRLDVLAMEQTTLRWVPVELTVAQDSFSRCILGLRLTVASTKAIDVANVLYQCTTPQPLRELEGTWPFHGVPQHVRLESEASRAREAARANPLPSCMPEEIVIDNGRAFASQHVLSACERLGISVQPAIPHKPTDKPALERFFRTLREGLLQHLPGYKGQDVHNRGERPETDAYLFVPELEQIIREWVGNVYHRTKHDGLTVPELPRVKISPAEMFEIGVARAGGLAVPTRADLPFMFLDVAWRQIHHYGVEVDGRRYDGAALNPYRGRRSAQSGKQQGKWGIYLDAHDVRRVWFRDPVTKRFEPLEWEHAASLDGPFSKDAADYVKAVARREQRHVDPHAAVEDLLRTWETEERMSRRDRAVARRLSAQRPHKTVSTGTDDVEAVAQLPTVIALDEARRAREAAQAQNARDDVFERFYDDYDGIGFEE